MIKIFNKSNEGERSDINNENKVITQNIFSIFLAHLYLIYLLLILSIHRQLITNNLPLDFDI